MFKRQLFLGAVKRNGFTLAEVSQMLSINEGTLYRKTTGISDFTREEIIKLRSCLQLSIEEAEVIFFDVKSALTQEEDPTP